MIDLDNMQPIIILGAGRSGTKFFRDVLLHSQETCAVPYDVNFIWRYGNESCEHDELSVDMATEPIKKYIRGSINNMAKKQNSKADFLLEKTVSNGLRVNYINEIFPEAKFIHIIRDGRAVTESALRMWKTPPEAGYLFKKIKYFPWRNYKYAIQYLINLIKGILNKKTGLQLWGPKYNGIHTDVANKTLLEVCATQWEKCVINTIDSLKSLPEDRYMSIKYEDFIQSPEVLNEVVEFIGIKDTEVIISEFKNKCQKGNTDKWKTSLEDFEIDFLNNRLSHTLTKLKYLD